MQSQTLEGYNQAQVLLRLPDSLAERVRWAIRISSGTESGSSNSKDAPNLAIKSLSVKPVIHPSQFLLLSIVVGQYSSSTAIFNFV